MRNYYGRGVNAYVGLWGSGKTLELARECLALQSEGVKIATNFGFHSQDFALATVDDWLGLVAAQLAIPPDERGRVHFALDELGMLFNSRDYAAWPAALNVVFFQGRKFKISLSYTVQDFAFVDANVRRVTQRVIKCRGHGRIRISEKNEPPDYRPALFSRSVYSAEEVGRARAARLDFGIGLMDKEAACSYDTLALISSVEQVLRSQVAKSRDVNFVVVPSTPATT